MDKLYYMKVFVRVAELKSFTKAGQTLGLQKSSVSSYMQNLEKSLGTRLLQRTTRIVNLTNDGMEFYEHCRNLLMQFDNLESMFVQDNKYLSGVVRIDMPNMLAQNVVIPKLNDFMTQFPKIKLEISCTDRKVDVIKEGFDCVIRAGELDNSSLIAKTVGYLEMVNCASKEYLNTYGIPYSLDDLDKHFLINYQANLGNGAPKFEYLEGNNQKYKTMSSKIAVNNAIAFNTALYGSFGIAQVPKICLLNDSINRKELVEILPQYKHKSIPLSIVYPYYKSSSKKAKVFIEWVEKILKEYLPI